MQSREDAVSRENAIRELAYRLWETRGRRNGHADEDWADAERSHRDSSTGTEPPIKVPNPPEGEVDSVIPEEPKLGSRDAPVG